MENKLNIKTDKPIAFLKIKTTGLNFVSDRIVEISIVKLGLDGSQRVGTRIVNPEMPMSEEVIKINNITNEMVAGQPTFKEIGEKMLKFTEGCDFAGFNVNFDLRFLIEECNRCGFEFNMINKKVIDLMEMYHSMEPRDFKSAMDFYCGEIIDKKEILSSEDINNKGVKLLSSMIDKYNDKTFETKEGVVEKVDNNIETLNRLFNKNNGSLDSAGFIKLNADGRPVFARGKYEGSLVSDTLLSDKSYYDFLTIKSDIPADSKSVIRKIYAKAEAASKKTPQQA
jgi:DNA polymerase-3 subunit epsilon